MIDFLKQFEEPRNFGCAGLILTLLLIVLYHKCSSSSDLSTDIEHEIIERQVIIPPSDSIFRRNGTESENFFAE